MTRLFLTLCAVLLAVTDLCAQRPDTSRVLALDPAVRHGRLDNGLTFYVRVNRYPRQRAELRLVVNAGSILEDEDQRGLAHFVEHMAFNGTTRFEKQELVNFIEGLGMRFGAHLNASTSFDETVYQLQVPTDRPEILPRAFDVLEDWAHGVTFEAEEVERERGVVVEEWRLGLGAEQRMFDSQLPVLFAGSRYAIRLPIGERPILESAPRDALVRFYRDWYRPDLMAVVAVGDFDPDSVEAMIRNRFARLEHPASPRARSRYDVPVQDTTMVAVAVDPEATSSRVTVAWRVPSDQRGTVGAYRESLVGQLHDQMLNIRLEELTRRENPPFLGAAMGRWNMVRTAEVVSLGAVVQDGGLERGLESAATEVERVRRHGFTAGELDRARQEFLRAYERAFAERENTPSSSFVVEYVSHFLEGEPSPGIAIEYALMQQLLPGISLEELNRAARQATGARGRILLANAPAKEGLTQPDAAALLAVFDRVTRSEVTAYQDIVADQPLVANRPTAGRIVQEGRDTVLGTTHWSLANGVQVVLKSTDFKADEILMSGWSPGGSSLAADSGYLSSALATTLVGLGGLGGFDETTLRKRLAGRTVAVQPQIGSLHEGLGGSTSPRDLDVFFELIYLTMTAPRADSVAFRAFQSNARSVVANRTADPDAVFADTVSAVLTQHHPRTRPITPEAVDSLDLGRAYQFYRTRFADASDFVFIFVGALEPDSLRPLVELWLGGLPALRRGERWRDVGIQAPRGVVQRTVRKGLEPKSSTRMVFTGPFEYSRANRAALRGLASVLDIRLREELREALGGTYGVSVSAAPTRMPRQEYSFSVSFGSAPERADELVAAVLAQIDTLRTRGPAAADLAKVVEAEVRARETNLRQNNYWLSQLMFLAQTGEPAAPVVNPRGDADLLDAAAIQRAARRWLDSANYVRVTLLPERPTP
jgi:zinc protease